VTSFDRLQVHIGPSATSREGATGDADVATDPVSRGSVNDRPDAILC
jgi:hypothetical protein